MSILHYHVTLGNCDIDTLKRICKKFGAKATEIDLQGDGVAIEVSNIAVSIRDGVSYEISSNTSNYINIEEMVNKIRWWA
jgi:hypothetical protein